MADSEVRKKLSVGCGIQATDSETLRLDKSHEVNPDVIWDLDKIPYPFEDSVFSEIECYDVIEHLQDITKTLEEFHRMLEPSGIVRITTPHFSGANSFVDPTHKWHLSYFSFDYFCEGHSLCYYSKARYRIKKRHIYFQGSKFYREIMRRVVNKFPKVYEQRWAWIFPALFIYFELEAIKLS